jgi:hypothetical protein
MASFIFNWTLACVCISIVFYFLGHTSPVLYAMGVGQTGAVNTAGNPAYGGKPLDAQAFVTALANVITSPTSMALLLGITVLGLVAGATGLLQQSTSFAAIYIIPLFIYLFMMNYVVMPWSMFFVDSNCQGVSSISPGTTGSLTPEQANACGVSAFGGDAGIIKWPILLLFNFFTVWAAITFIRGG